MALYIFGFLYQLLLVYDALRLKNTIQIIGLCIYNVGLLVYAAVQMDQIDEAIEQLSSKDLIDASVWNEEKPFLIAIPCVIGLVTVLMGIIAWKLYDEFAWTIYKHISADLKMKRRYLTFQVSTQCAEGSFVAHISLDLHRAPQIRLFLLPRIYDPICCSRSGPFQCRILPYHCSYPHHNHHSNHGWFLHTEGEHPWHACDHCKYHHYRSTPTFSDLGFM